MYKKIFHRDRGFGVYGVKAPEKIAHEYGTALVLNERAVRAGAGIMFLLASFAFYHALLLQDYRYLYAVAPLFFFDFLMKTLVGIRFSPIAFLAKKIVANQKPDFVPAAPKRFAWSVGLVLSGTMSVLLALGITGPVNFSVCLVCLSIMFLETSFGICLGCKLYSRFIA